MAIHIYKITLQESNELPRVILYTIIVVHRKYSPYSSDDEEWIKKQKKQKQENLYGR